MRQCRHPTCGETCRRPQKPKKNYQLKRTAIVAKPYKIKPVSDKRTKQNKEYKALKEKIIDPWDECEIKSPVCGGKAIVLHHSNGRENERLLNVEDIMKSCAECNLWIETSQGTKWAYDNGKKKHKHYKANNL